MEVLSGEEAAEREAEMERLELADRGFYSEPKVCSLCLGPTEDGELCGPCASYDEWMQGQLGSWWG
jgi:hypothetical protein